MPCIKPECSDNHDAMRRGFMRKMSLLAAISTAGLPVSAQASKKQRIISIGSAITEIIYALGAQEQIVGVDTTSLYPQAATRLPQVGYARTLAAEGILALAPTRIIATEDAGPPAVLRQLTSSGVTVDIVRANHTFEGMIDRIQRVGNLLGRQQDASVLTSKLTQDWQGIRQVVSQRTGKKPRVLYIMSHNPSQIMVSGRGSAAEAVISYAGGLNAINEFNGYKPLTPEAVIAAQPDIILISEQGLDALGGSDGLMKLPGLRQTSAGKKHRIITLDAVQMLGFGPRLPEAVATLDNAFARAMQS